MLSLPLLLAAQAAGPAPAPLQPQLRIASPAIVDGGLLVPQDTLIRLMVLNEVSTKTARPGDRFVLRVDEPVIVEGATIIPSGAKAWGEVLDAEESGHVGKAGRLSARLLSVEIGSAQVPISGENQSAGEKGGNQIALGLLALGPFALFARGNNAKLKAGEIFNAYFKSDMIFDPRTGAMKPTGGPAAAGRPR